MAKLKIPILSLSAIGRIGKVLTFKRARKTNIAEKTPVVPDQKTPAQLSWRHMYQKAVVLWHALDAAEKEDWESQARSRHMTGFAWFMSQALKPNPGLYLPLQGGTMAGDIDMARHRILELPIPVDPREPIRLWEFTTHIAPYLYHEGARVYHTSSQSIPNTTYTILAFNAERYDTDAIHDTAVFNSRLTCKTAGKYVITAHHGWFASATGFRETSILLNSAIRIRREKIINLVSATFWYGVATIYDLIVGDYLEVEVYQNTGFALWLPSAAQYTPEFSMQRIGA